MKKNIKLPERSKAETEHIMLTQTHKWLSLAKANLTHAIDCSSQTEHSELKANLAVASSRVENTLRLIDELAK